ncbi:MAG TPA: hypothetical protein VGL82_12135 [Bryobacteraceae bacterium]|jgi:hypothetical protein
MHSLEWIPAASKFALNGRMVNLRYAALMDSQLVAGDENGNVSFLSDNIYSAIPVISRRGRRA